MKNDNLYSRIASLIQYIEDNIEKNLPLELLSEVSYISKFHLIRVFKSIADITIIDYVRCRKLARSLEDLLNTNLKIVDIAVKYNFNYEQTYIRAFKEEFDISPFKYRKAPFPLKIVEKIDVDLCIDFKNGVLAKPIFVVRPEIKVVGIKDIISIEEKYTKNLANSRGISFYFAESHKIKNASNSNVYIGLTKVVSNDADYTYYMPCLEVSNFEEIPEGMCCETIPASKYIVFRYIGTHSPEEISIHTMKDLYNYIFQTWVYKNKYDFMLNGGFRFEDIDGSIASESYCEAKIYFPLKEK
jgi:AraC family transcriptional regulator